jgi:hypothetical protein
MVASLIPPGWELPNSLRYRLGVGPGRQRAMLADGHLLLVLHKPPKDDQANREGRLFWRKPDGDWDSSDLGGGPGAIGKHMSEYAAAIEKCDEMEHKATTAAEYFKALECMEPLQRATRNLHKVLQDAREKVKEDRGLIEQRDRAYDLERTAELLYNGAKNSLELVVARRAEDQAKSAHQMAVAAHKLNLLVAFFFPLATLMAIFSTNFHTKFAETAGVAGLMGMVVLGLIAGVILLVIIGKPPRSQK